MNDIRELLPTLRKFLEDPELREFRPLVEELIKGAETPGYDNINRVLELFYQNDLAYHCRRIAEELFYVNMFLAPPKNKWHTRAD